MTRYVLRRLAAAVLVMFIVSVLTFLATRVLFPDPVRSLMGGQDSAATVEQIEKMRADLGLSDPLIVQFFNWFGDLLQGDLGRSFLYPINVLDAIVERLPVTGELILLSITIALTVGTVLGLISALARGRMADTISSVVSVLALSMPNFFVGILLVYLFALQLRLLPSGGFVPFLDNPLENLRLMILPSITLALFYIGIFARYIRTLLIGTLSEDYVLRAYASGLGPRRIWVRYGLKNVMIPMVTVVGLNVAGLIGGAVVTETIFSLPGIGTLLTNSILGRDFPMTQGVILVVAIGVVTINLVVDLLYGLIDPRIKTG